MANKFLQGLAITFGGGLAFGAGLKLGQRALRSREGPQLSSLTGRLEAIEHRLESVELTPSLIGDGPRPEAFDAQLLDRSLGALETKLAQRLELVSGDIRQVEARLGSEIVAVSGQQSGQAETLGHRLDEIQTRLRSEMEAGDRRAQQQIEGFSSEVKRLEAELPAHIETAITPRIQALNAKFEKGLEQSQARTLDALIQTIETKVVQRMTDLEASLAGQSEVIGGLRDKSLRTDQNMQKLLLAVEKLCDQTERQMAHRTEPASERAAYGAGLPGEEPVPAQAVVSVEPATPAGWLTPPVRAPYSGAPSQALDVPPGPEAVRDPGAQSEPEARLQAVAIALAEAPMAVPEPVFEAALAVALAERNVALVAGQPQAEATPSSSVSEPMEPEYVEHILSPDGRVEAVPVQMPAEAAAEQASEQEDVAALRLLAPESKPRRRWRIPLAFSMLTIAGGLTGLQLLGVFQHAQGFSRRPEPVSRLRVPSRMSVTNAGEVSEADIRRLLERAATSPNDETTLLELGRAFSAKKEWGRAEQAFRSTLGANQYSKEAVLGLSNALYQQQKFDESSAVLAGLTLAK